MAKQISGIELEALEYIQRLTGKESVMYSTKQTSVRLETNNLATIDALAEMGNISRNQLINDALDFGLRLICKELDKKDIQKLANLTDKHRAMLEGESVPKTKRTSKGGE